MLHPILNATLNVTQACNLTCAYCFNWGKSAKRTTFEIGKKCIDFLLMNAREADEISLRGHRREIDVTFWGGEPLLEWDLMKKLVAYGKKVHREIPIRFGSTINGTLFTEEKVKFAKDHRISLLLSFDGTAESHDRYRRFRGGKGSHAIVASNIEQALKDLPGLRVRMSPYEEGIHRFYDDVKYITGMGIKNLMFSPVFESEWTPDRWAIFEEQCRLVSDLLLDYRKKGDPIEIEHYKSYAKTDRSHWPCGAGRFYVGFDVDGSMYPCHRFIKFNDPRPWYQKKVCIGHIDRGITNPIFRDKFIYFKPSKCSSCEQDKLTPCHGGCYAVNFDLTGDIATAPESLCSYVRMQSGISQSYHEAFGPKGFPIAREIPIVRPKAEAIMNVARQMEEKISLMEKLCRI